MEHKPELIPFDELLTTAKEAVEDAAYMVSLKVKNPKLKRQHQNRYNWWYSMNHYLSELQKLKQGTK